MAKSKFSYGLHNVSTMLIERKNPVYSRGLTCTILMVAGAAGRRTSTYFWRSNPPFMATRGTFTWTIMCVTKKLQKALDECGGLPWCWDLGNKIHFSWVSSSSCPPWSCWSPCFPPQQWSPLPPLPLASISRSWSATYRIACFVKTKNMCKKPMTGTCFVPSPFFKVFWVPDNFLAHGHICGKVDKTGCLDLKNV